MLREMIIGRASMGLYGRQVDLHRHATLWCDMHEWLARLARWIHRA